MTKQTDLKQLHLILAAQHHDPFNFLGLHDVDKKQKDKKQFVFRTFLPDAKNTWLKVGADWLPLEKAHQDVTLK